jgi:Fe-S cluster assembly protein SufD
MTQLAANTDLLHLSEFDSLASEAPGFVDQIRRSAVARFKSAGFPGPKDEQWRFTNISPITRTQFKLGALHEDLRATDLAAQYSFGSEASCEIVLVNGIFSHKLSRLGKLPKGVIVQSLSDGLSSNASLIQTALAKHADITRNPFVALNTSFIRDGVFIFVPRNVTVEAPVHLIYVSTDESIRTVSHPRTLILAEDNAELPVVESFVGAKGSYLTNAVTEIVLGNDCRIDHCKLQQESLDAYHVATMQVRLGRQTQFVSHAITIGGKLTRNDLNCVMDGDAAYATLNGLVLLKGSQHCDNHTLLDHARPNCPSHELYKHVLADKASAVFKGQILVRQPAQKTDSKQTSKSLLLSDDATMNSQPALEIYADDVKCTHGSTTGPVDEEMVFYLRSRGVGYEAARHLLTYAFAADITRRIKIEPVRARVEDYMANQHGLPQDLRINDLGTFDEAVTN